METVREGVSLSHEQEGVRPQSGELPKASQGLMTSLQSKRRPAPHALPTSYVQPGRRHIPTDKGWCS